MIYFLVNTKNECRKDERRGDARSVGFISKNREAMGVRGIGGACLGFLTFQVLPRNAEGDTRRHGL